MVIRDIQHIIETWAPKEIAWESDNIGLQVGSLRQKIRNILVTLDITEAVITEAIEKKVNLIISHHPLLYHPLKSINVDERIGRLLKLLIQSNIALYVAHTNLDFTRNGVSFALAKLLGLENIDFLIKNQRTNMKVAVFIPLDHVEKVFTAMTTAGAGFIGKYKACSSRSTGIGTFTPMTGAQPFIGTIGTREEVKEIRLETIVPRWKLSDVLKAMKKAHPYEEVAYDVYDLANTSDEYGGGAIGNLKKPMNILSFLNHTKRRLKIPALRHSASARRTISRIAVCGGSGSELIPAAIQQGADAFITADISYHRFGETDGKLLLVDAGHFETEYPVVIKITRYLKEEIRKQNSNISIFSSKIATNTIHYFNS